MIETTYTSSQTKLEEESFGIVWNAFSIHRRDFKDKLISFPTHSQAQMCHAEEHLPTLFLRPSTTQVFCFLHKQPVPSLNILSITKFALISNLKITVYNLGYYFLLYPSQAWKTAQVFILISFPSLKTQDLFRFLFKLKAQVHLPALSPKIFLSFGPSLIHL